MKRQTFFFCMAMVWPALATAQEVTVRLSQDNEPLEAALRNQALTLEVVQDDAANPQDIIAAARADYRRLLTALYADGYYGGTISIRVDGREASGLAPLFAPNVINSISIDIDAGPRFDFGTIDIGPVPQNTERPEGLATGSPAQSSLINRGVRAGVESWQNAGHAKAEPVAQAISAIHAEHRLDVSVTLAPGPQLTFGDLTINGNEQVRSSAIHRIAGLPIGAIYSPDDLTKAARRLRETGAFDGVALIEADDIGPGNTLPITAQIQESKPRRFGFGLELSTVEGLKLSSFWMHRNAFGGAERFRIEGEIAGIGGETGGIDYRLGSSLLIPAIYGPDTNFLGTFEISREDEPTYLLDSLSIEASATRIVTDDLTANLGIGLLRAREETAAGVRTYTLLTLPFGVEYDKRDDDTNTKNGYYIDADATPFVGLQGGANGGRLYVDARGFRSFGEDDKLTFAARAQLGSVIGATISDAPADFLFFSGGGGTVRGQSYNALGIVSGTTATGGTSFLGAQLEVRYDVTDKIGMVGFYDYGQIGTTALPGENGDWHSGTGIGIRYNTGIGPIRLDLGTPANGSDAFGSVQIYLGIGQAF